jgi:phasin family protein
MSTNDITKSGQSGNAKQPKIATELAPVAKQTDAFSAMTPSTPASHTISPSHVLAQSMQNKGKVEISKHQGLKPAEKADSKKSEMKRSVGTTKKSDRMSNNVVSISENAIRGAFTSGANKMAESRETVVAVGLDGATHLARGAETASRVWSESLSISRDHMEACAEASAIAVDCANRLSENMMNYANDAIAESVEISKRFFGCRTASDVFELQNKLAQSSVQRFLDESSRVSDMMFHMASKATEPFSEKLSDVPHRITSALKK